MSLARSAKLGDTSPAQVVPIDAVPSASNGLEFEFFRAAQCPVSARRAISDFLDTQDNSHPFQFPQWNGARLALLRRAGRVCWAAQCDVLAPAGHYVPIRALTVYRGPVGDDLDLMRLGLERLIQAGRQGKMAYVEIAPEWTGAFSDSAATMLAQEGWRKLPDARSSLRLALTPSPDDLLAGFRKTTRYEIRRSISDGILVSRADGEPEYCEFLKLYRTMASERKFPAEESKFLLSIFRWLADDPSRGGLFLARQDRSLRGGALVVRSGRRCWYIIGATSKEGKVGVGHLLQWRAIEWAKQHGCLEYDFGGFRAGVNTGPALFKKGFCDRQVDFIAPHRYVISPGRHHAAEHIAKLRRRLQH